MTKGELALVLHAHLPYVRSAKPGSLEEDWFFQALLECYLPLLQVLEDAADDPFQNPKLTLGLSPTLLSLLSAKDLKNRFPNWVKTRLDLLKQVPNDQKVAASDLSSKFELHLSQWHSIKGDLIEKFSLLEKRNVLDILTCAASHGYLPLLRESPTAVRGQLLTAVKEHKRLIGKLPKGIWLPECAYYEGLDKFLLESGLRYAVLDGHGILNATPRPRYGVYAPICSKNGIAFFARDSDSTLPVWSAKDGYPGASFYREFHRDLGWDLDEKELNKINIKNPRPLGIKLHRITGKKTPLDQKEIYEPESAKSLTKEHAKDYLEQRLRQLKKLTLVMNKEPLLVAPFDAELFGHWWFEGPSFLAELFKQSQKENLTLTTLKDVLLRKPNLQLCEPSPSSWGSGGFHDYWINECNSWLIPEWSRASRAMEEILRTKSFKDSKDIINQAARELLLSQSSDWSFILRAGTTTELAKNRIKLHLKRYWLLIDSLKNKKLLRKEDFEAIKEEDSIFPFIETKDWFHFKD